MYAVIFKADISQLDDDYQTQAQYLRELAIKQYGCLEFTACTENRMEIAISYWPSLENIQAWKNHPEHLTAQQLGKSTWYKSYQVQVVEILREYGCR